MNDTNILQRNATSHFDFTSPKNYLSTIIFILYIGTLYRILYKKTILWPMSTGTWYMLCSIYINYLYNLHLFWLIYGKVCFVKLLVIYYVILIYSYSLPFFVNLIKFDFHVNINSWPLKTPISDVKLLLRT